MPGILGIGALGEAFERALEQLHGRSQDVQAGQDGHQRVEPGDTGQVDERHPQQDRPAGPDVGQHVVTVRDEHQRVEVLARADEEQAEGEVDEGQGRDDPEPQPELVKLGALDQPLDAEIEDPARRREDQAALGARREVGELAVAVRVVVVGGPGREPEGVSRDAGRHDVDHRFGRVGEDGGGPRQERGTELADQHEDGHPEARRHREIARVHPENGAFGRRVDGVHGPVPPS
ncbi:hypothetical protein D3C86_1453540 [compost metagenome]